MKGCWGLSDEYFKAGIQFSGQYTLTSYAKYMMLMVMHDKKTFPAFDVNTFDVNTSAE